MTAQTATAAVDREVAAMEPAEDRPDDDACAHLVDLLLEAAMEPAEDRPDDFNRARDALIERAAAMEPAEDRPDDSRARAGARPRQRAAMEPAEDRPDDVIAFARWRASTWPQWSRPRIGRMTAIATLIEYAHIRRNGAGRGSAG